MMIPRMCKRPIVLAGLAGLVIAALAASAVACSVPVFRYALLWWGARAPEECYQVMVFHHGPLNTPQQAALETLERNAWLKDGGANYVVTAFDMDAEIPEAAKAIAASRADATDPWMVLRYPPTTRIEQEVWAGELDAPNVEHLLNSPKRREIAKRLLAGETAVWLLLETGARDQDDAAAAVLTKRLAQLENELQLPSEADDPIDTPEDRALEAAATGENLPALQIKFSVLRLSRDDPENQLLWRMLRHSEADLEQDYADVPVAFPVFGRGRTLWGLVGKGINDDIISEYCGYMVGMCSCEIKAQNPGFDLLLNANWDEALDPGDADGATVLPRLPGVIEAPVAAPPPSSSGTSDHSGGTPTPSQNATIAVAAPAPASSNRLLWSIVAAIAVVILGLVTMTVWVQRRYSQNQP